MLEKKFLVNNLKIENFPISIGRESIELGKRSCFENIKFSTDRKTHSIDRNLEFLKKLEIFLWNQFSKDFS